MIRLLIILIIFVSGYGSLFYFFNNAGNLSLVLGMWQLSIPIVQFLFVFITFLVLLILFSYAFTKLFIYPGYSFKAVDRLITNFHLPQSSLLMLVSAFIGYDNMRHIYKTAVDMEYRFLSYGDAMLLEKNEI